MSWSKTNFNTAYSTTIAKDDFEQHRVQHISNYAALEAVLTEARLLAESSLQFLDLGDTPASYSGQGEKYLKVNPGETALEFAPLPSRARAGKAASAQIIGTATITKVVLEAEQYDNLNEYDPVTNYRFTAANAGYYQVNVSIRWSSNAVVGSLYMTYIYKNGTLYSGAGGGFDSANHNVSVSDVIPLAANDYIEIFVYQNSGANATVYNEVRYTFMSIHRLS